MSVLSFRRLTKLGPELFNVIEMWVKNLTELN